MTDEAKPTPQFAHDDRFVEPFANRPHTVLGKRLFPFSLWTQFNLELAQSPFLLGHRQPNLHDLHVAVQCASTPWTPEHYVPDVGIPRLTTWRGIKWVIRMRRYSYRMELAKFYAYLNDFAGGPKFWSNEHLGEGCDRVRDIDSTLELSTFAEHEFGWEPRVVWTMPLGQLRWRTAVVGRMKGSTARILTLFDEAREEETRKEVEAALKVRTAELVRTFPKMAQETAERLARDEHEAKKKANLTKIRTTPNLPAAPRGESI